MLAFNIEQIMGAGMTALEPYYEDAVYLRRLERILRVIPRPDDGLYIRILRAR
ncbi:hypothetical protein HMPREF0591_3578 [Mycobacterium parascrofulaceum ATCC BAA-614]|uniref:Uncharacterized protein n=1 Tax=Mycobacterium parascrofulaceum ATCC BAA-614 TaxID=525368 RepID=D5PBN4_9MYCO|nr:hypothetical protein HMPREF0591_3578 [Mycobacterium parascrofulaceum ATCC BAA-614]